MLAKADEILLRRSIELAVESRTNGDHPFGALLAMDRAIVMEAHNRVHSELDITAHAELNLVRVLERAGRLADLAGGTVYASCEPCPMCVGALFWAGARRVVFGLSAARLNELANPSGVVFGFEIDAPEIGRRAQPPMQFLGPHLADEAEAAHADYW